MTRSLEQERNALLDRVATLERQWEQDELRQKVAMLAELIRRQCDHLTSCPAYCTPEPRPIHPRCTCGLSEAVRSLACEANEWRRVFSERDEARAEVGRLRVELATQPYTPRVDVAAVVRWLEAEAADWDDTAARYPYLVHASENADLIRALAVTATAKLVEQPAEVNRG